MSTPSAAPRLIALILCGGRGSRMGGVDKPLQLFQGRPLVAHVLDRVAPQVEAVILSANRHLDDYRAFGHPVIGDALPDFPGPLAGLLAGLDALGLVDAAPDAHVLCVSGDSPFLPPDLAERLRAALDADHDSAMALGREAPGEALRAQPLACLVHRRHRDVLAVALAAGERRVQAFLRGLPLALVPFDRPDDDQAFANINDRDELERLEHRR